MPFAGAPDRFYSEPEYLRSKEEADADEQQYLMKIPTTLYLTDLQIDRLLSAATKLIRQDPEFQRLMRDLE